MNIKPIHTKADYCATLNELEGLMGAERRTLEGDRLEVLTHQRPLTLRMIQGLHTLFRIPAESLIGRSA